MEEVRHRHREEELSRESVVVAGAVVIRTSLSLPFSLPFWLSPVA
jgi:hypothetical protein